MDNAEESSPFLETVGGDGNWAKGMQFIKQYYMWFVVVIIIMIIYYYYISESEIGNNIMQQIAKLREQQKKNLEDPNFVII